MQSIPLVELSDAMTGGVRRRYGGEAYVDASRRSNPFGKTNLDSGHERTTQQPRPIQTTMGSASIRKKNFMRLTK